MEKGALATKCPKMSLPHQKSTKKPGTRQGRKNMEKRPWPRRARKLRFHTRHLSRNQGGVARHQKHGKAPPGQEGPQNVDSIQEIYQGTRGVARRRKHGQGPLATKGPKMSLPRVQSIKKPVGRGKAPQTWKKGPWPRRAPTCRFHTRNLSRNQGGRGKAAKGWKSAPGHERQGRKNMEKRPVATKGPTMSLPHKKSIKDPGEAWQGTKNM